MNREEFSNIFISGPIDWNTQIVSIDFLELTLKLRAVEPIISKPVQICELLVGKLIEFTVWTGCKVFAHEIINIKGWQRNICTISSHPVSQIYGQLQP